MASTSKGKQSMQPDVRTKSSSFHPHKPQMPTGCSRKDRSQPTVLIEKEMVFSPDDKAQILTTFSAYMNDCITDPKKQVKSLTFCPTCNWPDLTSDETFRSVTQWTSFTTRSGITLEPRGKNTKCERIRLLWWTLFSQTEYLCFIL